MDPHVVWSPVSHADIGPHVFPMEKYRGVADRLRAEKVGIRMSGGIDSTALAVVARRVGGADLELHAYTSVFESLMPDEEGRYAAMVAERLELPEQQGMRGVTAGTAGVGRMRVVRLDSVRVGGAAMRELPACVVELAHARQVGVEIEGLIGLNFLRAFRVGIDFDRRVLSLQAP